MSALSQQPYFLRALYEWCVDSGLTPYLTVKVDSRTRVPQGYVKDGQIVLNVGPSAVRNMQMDNEWVTFSARFGGASHVIEVPVGNVLAIYAKETGEGMSFEFLPRPGDATVEAETDTTPSTHAQDETVPSEAGNPSPPQPPKGKPRLRVVK
ncbi:MAG: ClpXP protease specificity-enhancing factor [Betaproteobacteria bacterium]|nr:ClpXP protease specificity-enhancing factor [Betaproteobacteria bacterium]